MLLAALADLRTDRIPNGYILFGAAIGAAGGLICGFGILQSALSAALAFLLLYPLFKIGALGAGDVKVFMMVAVFTEPAEFFKMLVLSFVIGAGFSLFKLLAEHNGRERLYYFLSYLADVIRTRQWKLYGEHTAQDYERYRKNKIHFTVPILFGVVLRVGGVI